MPGVPVGVVGTVEKTPGSLTRSATIKPYVDFTAIDLVGVVVQPPRRDPRDAVLPAPPTPAKPPAPPPVPPGKPTTTPTPPSQSAGR